MGCVSLDGHAPAGLVLERDEQLGELGVRHALVIDAAACAAAVRKRYDALARVHEASQRRPLVHLRDPGRAALEDEPQLHAGRQLDLANTSGPLDM